MSKHTVDLWWSDLRAMDLGLLRLLDPVEEARARQTDRAGDLGRFVVGAVLLQVAVAAATGAPPEAVTVDRTCERCGGPHGRPRVEGTHVSVAHAGPLVAVATCPLPVGVDVEALARGGDVEAWVVEEAVFKATGSRVDPGVAVLAVEPPLPGHAAALASTVPVVVRPHWPAESAAGIAAVAGCRAQGRRR
ncbi:4'-phosphopantetheinyl transferase family protein [Janibacter indicus]